MPSGFFVPGECNLKKLNWQKDLASLLRERQNTPFEWGENDCCLFVSDCILAMTGKDVAAEYRGRYTTEIGAKRVLNRLHGSIENVLDEKFERVPASHAQRGDLIMFDSELGKTMGILWSSELWSVGLEGACVVSEYQALSAWRVD